MTADTPDRAERFRDEIEQMQLKTTTEGADRALRIGGLLLMVAAVVVGVVAWSSSTSLSNSLDQTELIVLGAAIVSAAILGASLYVVASIKTFLRAWLLRILYEGRATPPESDS